MRSVSSFLRAMSFFQNNTLRVFTDGEKDPVLDLRRGMICQRCSSNEAAYRVYSDLIDMKVCSICAGEACKLGIAVEALHSTDR
jgi:hypothetical protein